MKIIKEISESQMVGLETKGISFKSLGLLKGDVSLSILKLLAKKEMYPKEIAKELNTHEQNIYYYIRKLELAKIIHITKQERINGTIANYYSLVSDSFFVKFKEFKEISTLRHKESSFLEPFILEGQLDALIIVGSPDPHGPQKARSKDGYFGMDLALFLGSFLTYITTSKVRLDTEVSKEELESNNLIVIGGPIVNRVNAELNSFFPIHYDEDKRGMYSKVSKKTYYSDEIGIINKIKNPYNKEKKVLSVMGLRNAGTKAAILAFLKHFSEIKEGNIYHDKTKSKVVEGVDFDSDGVVDDVEFLE